MNWRYLTLSLFIAVLLVSAGWIASGRIKFQFFPIINHIPFIRAIGIHTGKDLHQCAFAGPWNARHDHGSAAFGDNRSVQFQIFVCVYGYTPIHAPFDKGIGLFFRYGGERALMVKKEIRQGL